MKFILIFLITIIGYLAEKQKSIYNIKSLPNYNFDEIVQSANLANAAYCFKSNLLKWKCGKPCKLSGENIKVEGYYEDVILGTAAYIATLNGRNDTLIISFRGTQNLQSIMVDLMGNRLDYSYGKSRIHSGFYYSYLRLSKNLFLKFFELSNKKNKNAEIRLVGHSLGGVFATLTALDFKHRFNITNKITIHTFGMPRIGDAKFNNLIKATFEKEFKETNIFPLLRITQNNDLIPHLPLSSNGFVHSPHELMIKESGILKDCNDLDGKDAKLEDPKCSYGTKLPDIYSHLTYFNITFGLECQL